MQTVLKNMQSISPESIHKLGYINSRFVNKEVLSIEKKSNYSISQKRKRHFVLKEHLVLFSNEFEKKDNDKDFENFLSSLRDF